MGYDQERIDRVLAAALAGMTYDEFLAFEATQVDQQQPRPERDEDTAEDELGDR
jgi:hypothetical protein